MQCDQFELDELRRYKLELTRASERLERFFGHGIGLLAVTDGIDEVLTKLDALVQADEKLIAATQLLLRQMRLLEALAAATERGAPKPPIANL